MLSKAQKPTHLLAAGAIALIIGLAPRLPAQVLQQGLQPGLTRAPDSARKISLTEAVRMA
jgi:hypothetical protein